MLTSPPRSPVRGQVMHVPERDDRRCFLALISRLLPFSCHADSFDRQPWRETRSPPFYFCCSSIMAASTSAPLEEPPDESSDAPRSGPRAGSATKSVSPSLRVDHVVFILYSLAKRSKNRELACSETLPRGPSSAAPGSTASEREEIRFIATRAVQQEKDSLVHPRTGDVDGRNRSRSWSALKIMHGTRRANLHLAEIGETRVVLDHEATFDTLSAGRLAVIEQWVASSCSRSVR